MNIEEQINEDKFRKDLVQALKSVCPTEGPFPRKPEIQVKKKVFIETRDGDEFTVEEYEKHRGEIDWVKGLLNLINSTRILNCLAYQFDHNLIKNSYGKKMFERISCDAHRFSERLELSKLRAVRGV